MTGLVAIPSETRRSIPRTNPRVASIRHEQEAFPQEIEVRRQEEGGIVLEARSTKGRVQAVACREQDRQAWHDEGRDLEGQGNNEGQGIRPIEAIRGGFERDA